MILEKTICSRFNQHLSINNIIATEKCGFRRNVQQNMRLLQLLMESFRFEIVNCKYMEVFVTSLRLSTGFPHGSVLGPLSFITYK